MDWTRVVWWLLCLLTVMSGIAAMTGLVLLLPPLWQGLCLVPGLVVVLLLAVAAWSDSLRDSSGR